MNEYLFDMQLIAAVRIKAATEDEAREKLAIVLDCATVNFGAVDGEPLIGEASLFDNEAPALAEINGEAV